LAINCKDCFTPVLFILSRTTFRAPLSSLNPTNLESLR
jgi:hypothetical protein